jgi:hypothetical protein
MISIPLKSLKNENHLCNVLKLISFFRANEMIIRYKSIIQCRLGKHPLLTVRTTEMHEYSTV